MFVFPVVCDWLVQKRNSLFVFLAFVILIRVPPVVALVACSCVMSLIYVFLGVKGLKFIH